MRVPERCRETGWIILYHGGEIVLRRPARTSEDVKEAAREWRRSIQLGVTVGVPEPTPQAAAVRRRVTRGGRAPMTAFVPMAIRRRSDT